MPTTIAAPSPKVTPFLWFDYGQALEAASFYISLFPATAGYDSRITDESSLVVSFTLCGQPLSAMNGGPMFVRLPTAEFLLLEQLGVERRHCARACV